MLLQIIDPNESKENSSPKKAAIGIDLGTTHCVLSAIDRCGKCFYIPIDGHATMPSVVVVNDDDYDVGHDAIHHKNALHSVKRFMHRPADPIENYGTPVEISAKLLKKIKSCADDYLKEDITDAVITVPAYFDETQRQATKDAARLAGLNVLRLLNEPTAAAVAYGLDADNDAGLYLVYDFGGGTFDVSILNLKKGVFRVLATGGDTQLGGDDIDSAILNFLNLNANPKNMMTARQLKESLKDTPETTIDGHTLSRDNLKDLTLNILNQTIEICQKTLRDAGVPAHKINAILCVGGSTRLYGLKNTLKEALNIPVHDDINPDLIVSFGAACQAHALTHGGEHVLMDVTPLSLGIETMGGIFEKIIHKNTPIPVAKAQEFTTSQDNQTALKVHVLQGEREMIADCRSLAQFTLKNIPPMPSGLPRILITFRLDADGLLTVEALEKHTQIQQHVEIKPSYGLDEDTLLKMIYSAHEHGEEDMRERLLTQSIVQSEHLLQIVQKAIDADFELLPASTLEIIKENMYCLEKAIKTRVREDIELYYEALSKASQEFAEKRIEKAIQQKLVGETV